ERIGSSNASAAVGVAATSSTLRVMHARDHSQLGGLFLGSGVVEKVSTANLRAREILEETWFAQRWMDLDVKVKSRMVLSVCRRLVEHHHVRKWHAPQIVESN